jgi:hypothetical protein
MGGSDICRLRRGDSDVPLIKLYSKNSSCLPHFDDDDFGGVRSRFSESDSAEAESPRTAMQIPVWECIVLYKKPIFGLCLGES